MTILYEPVKKVMHFFGHKLFFYLISKHYTFLFRLSKGTLDLPLYVLKVIVNSTDTHGNTDFSRGRHAKKEKIAFCW